MVLSALQTALRVDSPAPHQDERPVLLLVDPSKAVTGAFVCARNMAETLSDEFRVVLVLPEQHTIPDSQLRPFWRVETMPIRHLSKDPKQLVRYLPDLLRSSLQLRWALLKLGAQRLQMNDFYLPHGFLLRALGFRGHIATWIRCDPKSFAGFLSNPLLWAAKMSSDRIVLVSEFIRTLVPESMAGEVIYDYFTPANDPIAPKPKANDKRLVYIGNYIQGKGQDFALEAFALASDLDASLRLEFYGGDMGLSKNQAYRRRLEERARQLGLEDRVRFGDFLDNPNSVLSTAYGALNFSRRESFSMTVLEASGLGVPVICTACGGPQEIIEDGQTGFVVPLDDTQAAADAMLKLAQNPDRASSMGQAGQHRVADQFSKEQFRSAVLPTLNAA